MPPFEKLQRTVAYRERDSLYRRLCEVAEANDLAPNHQARIIVRDRLLGENGGSHREDAVVALASLSDEVVSLSQRLEALQSSVGHLRTTQIRVLELLLLNVGKATPSDVRAIIERLFGDEEGA